MSGLLNKLKTKVNTELVPTSEVKGTIRQLGKYNFKEIYNAKTEDFVQFVFYKESLYTLGFLGMNCISRKYPVDVSGSEESFVFSLNKEMVDLISNRESLVFELKDNKLRVTFKYGEGLMQKVLKPSLWREDSKTYLEFILAQEDQTPIGEVSLNELKSFHNHIKTIINDEKSRNIVLEDGYAFCITPTSVFFKPVNISGTVLLTNTLLSNLPRRNDMKFEIKHTMGLQCLTSKEGSLYYIFKPMGFHSSIDPYKELNIDWIASLPDNFTEALNVVSFGSDKLIELVFKTNVMKMSDPDDKSNVYVSNCQVLLDRKEYVNSVVRKMKNIDKIGRVETKNTVLRAFELRGGLICLMN